MLSKHDAIDATSSARWRGARAVSTRGQRQCLKMEKLGRIRDAAGDSSSVSSLGDLRSTDLMPSDCARGGCIEFCDNSNRSLRDDETRSRGDYEFCTNAPHYCTCSARALRATVRMLWTLDLDDLCRQINARDAHLQAHGCSRRCHRCKRIAQRGKGSQYCNHTVHRCK